MRLHIATNKMENDNEKSCEKTIYNNNQIKNVY